MLLDVPGADAAKDFIDFSLQRAAILVLIRHRLLLIADAHKYNAARDQYQ
jgi:hypothetical protein